MNLLLINYEYPPLGGGAGKATAAIAREMAALGHRVRVLTSAYRGLSAREEQNGYTVIRSPALRRRPDRSTPVEMISFLLGALPVALRESRRERPDASIAFFGIPSGPVAYLLRLIYGVPYLISLRGGDVPGFQPYDLAAYHRITRPVIRWLWKRSAGVVANSAGLRDLAQQTAPDLPIHVIPNGIDLAPFPPPNRSSNASATPCLLFVGRVVQQKGLNYLLEALATLDLPFTLRIAGDGDQRAWLEDLACRLGLADRAAFLGWQSREELAYHYAHADVFVLPSLDEGMPNVVLEAMACGLPVVATSVPGCVELVTPGENGLLVPPRDPAALAGALRLLLADSDLRRRMGQAGYRRAQGYTWQAAAQGYLNIIALLPKRQQATPFVASHPR